MHHVRHMPGSPAARATIAVLAALAGVAHGEDAVDPHAHHREMMAATNVAPLKVSSERYVLPAIDLVRQDGQSLPLARVLDDGRPVLLNFIYTTCTTICPLSSHILSELQAKLGDDSRTVHLVSISIDPEQDTPAHLAEYAHAHHAGPSWDHYTGTVGASLAVQRAFNVYRGDKMAHFAVTFLRRAPGEPWTRVEGFATSDELLTRYRKLAAGG